MSQFTAIQYAGSSTAYTDVETGQKFHFRGDIPWVENMTEAFFKTTFLEQSPVIFSANDALNTTDVRHKLLEELWTATQNASLQTGSREDAGFNRASTDENINLSCIVKEEAPNSRSAVQTTLAAIDRPEISSDGLDEDISSNSHKKIESRSIFSSSNVYVFDKSLLLTSDLNKFVSNLPVPSFLPRAAALEKMLEASKTDTPTCHFTSGKNEFPVREPRIDVSEQTGNVPRRQRMESLLPSNHLLLAVGMPGSGTTLHRHNHSWNILLCGVKLWIIYPPHMKVCDLPKSVTEPLRQKRFKDVQKWSTSCLNQMTWESYLKNRKNSRSSHLYPFDSADEIPYIFIQREGEIVYLPENFHHATINLHPQVLCRSSSNHSHLHVQLSGKEKLDTALFNDSHSFGMATVAVAHVADGKMRQSITTCRPMCKALNPITKSNFDHKFAIKKMVSYAKVEAKHHKKYLASEQVR